MIKIAEIKDLDAVMELYDYVIDELDKTDIDLRWIKGVYPSRPFAENATNNSELLLYKTDDELVGCAVVNNNAIPEYDTVNWCCNAQPEKVALIHALAISPKYQGKGEGKRFVSEIIEYCRKVGFQTIRLDVLSRNKPAFSLYNSAGFNYVGPLKMTYPTTGEESFEMFEYIL